MNFSEPTNLGVIACPGGEQFADKVIKHLKGIYRRRFDRKAAALSKRYGIDREEAARRLNFHSDLVSTTTSIPNSGTASARRRSSWRPPSPAFPTASSSPRSFPPCAVRDIYIFQDVENRQPCAFNRGSTQRVLSINDHIFNVLTTADAALQAGARRVSLVLPVYPTAASTRRRGARA
jgi:ribose-phosphate pyrophosphokinase